MVQGSGVRGDDLRQESAFYPNTQQQPLGNKPSFWDRTVTEVTFKMALHVPRQLEVVSNLVIRL